LINFISNLPADLRTGGFSAMNAAAHEALCKLDTIHYVGPINPPTIFQQKIISKLLRTFGSQGSFFAFSRKRLETIAKEVSRRCSSAAGFDFFHGFTPWILTKPARPYAAWSDCTFRDYIDIYHRRELFEPADIERIERAEAAWLSEARCIGLSSGWAARRAVSHYGLDASLVSVVGNFGEMETLGADGYVDGKQFVFASTDFDAKGGPTVISAFRQLRQRHTDVSLVIIGAHPADGGKEHGVSIAGYLRKEVPSEYAAFRKILSAARCLVHPTRSDISPLIIIEAAYFGCPAIASNRFAIPELVDHGVTGILLDDLSVCGVADAMSWMLENESRYRQMRMNARAKATSCYSKSAFEAKLHGLVAPLMIRDGLYLSSADHVVSSRSAACACGPSNGSVTR
jgi:glycosyltransferase involved in cell wall biosynthesis